MKKIIFPLMLVLLSSMVLADCRAVGNETATTSQIENLLADAYGIEERIDSRSFWKKIFMGGDLENGKELESVVNELNVKIKEGCCKCDMEMYNSEAKRLEIKATMEINRKGTFGWFRGFY